MTTAGNRGRDEIDAKVAGLPAGLAPCAAGSLFETSEESIVSVRIQVLFYSMYGHSYRMSEAVVKGAREVEGADVSLYQVAELVPEEALEICYLAFACGRAVSTR